MAAATTAIKRATPAPATTIAASTLVGTLARKETKQEGTLRVIDGPDKYGSVIIEVTIHHPHDRKPEITQYAIDPLGGNNIAGETFVITRMDSDADRKYHLHVWNDQDYTCECKGHEHGYVCRHFKFVKALRERGVI